MNDVPAEILLALERLQSERFTGSMTVHMAEGRFKLVEEKRAWKPEPLDKPAPTSVG